MVKVPNNVFAIMQRAVITGKRALRVATLPVAISLAYATQSAYAAPLPSHVKSLPELEYGVVLYDYFQKSYFSALVEYEYSFALNNPLATQDSGKVLKGGMMLSYGMPKVSQQLFGELLDDTTTTDVSNRAWYYLAKIYYNKSEYANAKVTLNKVKGDIPADIFFDYYYLSTLIGNADAVSDINQTTDSSLSSYIPGYPYLLFNMAIGFLEKGDTSKAVSLLTQVTEYSGKGEELSVLSDRAKNGLAQLSAEQGQLSQAWKHLSGIRTTGLYSNRALLAYAWSAINAKKYNDAIPALKALNERSIAIPEVQETKVLLAHLYEQQGASKKALQSNILAEKEFKSGIEQVQAARKIIDGLNVPREFINNLEAIMAKSDWYASTPSVDYQKLTPFLIDLMSSNAFNEVLKELADLYAIRDNINYWLGRSVEHRIVLANASQKQFNKEIDSFFEKSNVLRNTLAEQKSELKLHTLSLSKIDQERMTALIETTEKELAFLDDKVSKLTQLESAYKQPESYQALVDSNHQRLDKKLKKTQQYIDGLEPIMRKLVNLELDEHEKRIRYYWAQSRLAKVRLYDKQLLSLEQPKRAAATPADTTPADAKAGAK